MEQDLTGQGIFHDGTTLCYGENYYIKLIVGISSGINRYDAYIQHSLRFKQHPLKRMLGS